MKNWYITIDIYTCCVFVFGKILLSLVNNRPSSKNFTHSDVLQSWTRATNVRLRLMRTKNLLGHLMAVAKQDPTVTRRVNTIFFLFYRDLYLEFFYSVFVYSISTV